VAGDGRPQRGAQNLSAILNGHDVAGNPVRFYDFDRFRLDAKRRLLMRDGEIISIKPKALDTLLLLVQHRDRLLGKDELMTRLWPDTIVEESNLTQNIFVIRKALGEAPSEQRFIATVARQGYRFVGDVRQTLEEGPSDSQVADGGSASTLSPAAAESKPTVRRQSRVWRVLSAAAVLLVVVAGIWLVLARQRTERATAETVRSIAVLPFRNSSGDAGDEYFADGVTEAITTDIASISALRVISRQSVTRFKGSIQPLPEIARTLGVDALIQGAVARSGGRVRVTVQLVHGASDRHLWAETYDRPLGDVLALQGQLASAVAASIRVQLSDVERNGLTDRRAIDPDAYALYLRGKHFLNRRSEAALRQSIELFQQSVSRDPTFAAAYGEMAIAYQLLESTMATTDNQRYLTSAAMAALALDPRQPDARAALAFGVADVDAAASLARIEAVARDNPNHALSQNWYGSALIEACRHEEGMVQRQLSVQLDPLSPIAHLSLGLELARRGRIEEALASLNTALELEPNYADAHGLIGWVYLQQGKVAEGIEKFETCARVSKNSARMVARLAHAYGLVGRADDARRLLRELEKRSRTERVTPIHFAEVFAGLGEFDRAFAQLEAALAQGLFLRLNANPLFIPLYKDPRFAALGRRANETAPCPSAVR
jgi:TolB-like protein/DNA-binding winged helix-turn-helix (wHTH) protein/Flp pilus assembly protein TadD